jgi:hypothetical protein
MQLILTSSSSSQGKSSIGLNIHLDKKESQVDSITHVMYRFRPMKLTTTSTRTVDTAIQRSLRERWSSKHRTMSQDISKNRLTFIQGTSQNEIAVAGKMKENTSTGLTHICTRRANAVTTRLTSSSALVEALTTTGTTTHIARSNCLTLTWNETMAAQATGRDLGKKMQFMRLHRTHTEKVRASRVLQDITLALGWKRSKDSSGNLKSSNHKKTTCNSRLETYSEMVRTSVNTLKIFTHRHKASPSRLNNRLLQEPTKCHSGKSKSI